MAGVLPVRFVLSKRTFYISLHFPSETSFVLRVWDGKTLWEGTKSGQELNELIPDGMTYDTYFELLREAFKAQDKEAKRFSYGIARHTTIKTDANFKWTIKTNFEAMDEEDDALIAIDLGGEIHLSVVAEDKAKKIIQEMMDELLASRNELSSESASLKRLNEVMKSQRTDALQMLERLEVEKRAAEVEQFSKFVLILNAKKAKIAELRKELAEKAISHERLSQAVSARPSQSISSPPAKVSASGTQASADLLDVPFDSHEVYSLSSPPLARRKSDLIMQGNMKPILATKLAGASTRPHNILDLHSQSLASQPSSLSKQFSNHNHLSSATPSRNASAKRLVPTKRPTTEDLLDIDSFDDEFDFALPDPKRWKH